MKTKHKAISQQIHLENYESILHVTAQPRWLQNPF